MAKPPFARQDLTWLQQVLEIKHYGRWELGAVALADAEEHGVILASGRPGFPEGLTPSSSSPRASCTFGQAGPLPHYGKGFGMPGATTALPRYCQAGDTGRTRCLSLWFRYGFAMVYLGFYASSHPSSSGTMALVVWTTLPM